MKKLYHIVLLSNNFDVYTNIHWIDHSKANSYRTLKIYFYKISANLSNKVRIKKEI